MICERCKTGLVSDEDDFVCQKCKDEINSLIHRIVGRTLGLPPVCGEKTQAVAMQEAAATVGD